MISVANLAYIAGLFDGDGAIMALIEKHSEKKFGFRVRVILKVTQKNPEVLHWIQKTTKLGNVVSNRTTNEWILRNQIEILEFLKQMVRFVRIKKKQIIIAIAILQKPVKNQNDLVNIATLADSLASFNVRSKNRRKNFITSISVN
ncbi:MAG: hypothetical protein ACD_19C00431G0011 [uncultured bacterium]|nr:MAG: hypothetical protein ACD_19C00431G0011 [uncultured bacterium]